MIFTTPTFSTNHISISGNIIEQVTTFKYLGQTLNINYTFEHHIKDIHKCSQQRLHVLHTLSALHVAPHLLLLLHQSIIQSILLYSSPACTACCQSQIEISFSKSL
ncbi:hypothetical protein AMECASPLE_026848 [Ameca splendens]|uniref:Alkylated DNA repair protein AlkB homologue 8 N-terminal domain-containing protein n=1 Tax=Ameca splendens TaxID=208324 RepID=A0ABV0YGT6_9TELE